MLSFLLIPYSKLGDFALYDSIHKLRVGLLDLTSILYMPYQPMSVSRRSRLDVNVWWKQSLISNMYIYT